MHCRARSFFLAQILIAAGTISFSDFGQMDNTY
jgi:hypothetical protein